MKGGPRRLVRARPAAGGQTEQGRLRRKLGLANGDGDPGPLQLLVVLAQVLELQLYANGFAEA